MRYEPTKNNLQANQKGYDTFETTVGKLSARRIQICRVYVFLFRHYFESYSEKKRAKIHFTKIDPADPYSPRRVLSNGGLGIVVTLLVRL